MPVHLNHERNLIRMSELRAQAESRRRSQVRSSGRQSAIGGCHGARRQWLAVRRALGLRSRPRSA